jgi:ABC-2 type transport system ATP-binding protein
MIEVRGLTRYYGTKPGVADVTFDTGGYGLVGLLGPNGAGKSTVMKLITTVIAPTSGSITVAGVDAVARPGEACRHIGYMPEVPPLYPDMTVYAYLVFVARIKGIGRSAEPSHVGGIMERTGVAKMKDRLLKNLSKGYRQRVGLAQALIGYPEILVLDEPTAGLDPQQIASVRSLLKELSKDHSIILSSHILSEISMVCEKVIIIDRGRVAAADTVDGMSSDTGGVMLVVKADRETARARILETDGVLSAEPSPFGDRRDGDARYSRFRVSCEGEEAREALFYALASSRVTVLEMTPALRTLEQVFLQVTAGADEGKNEER